jgi:hypothetical protein
VKKDSKKKFQVNEDESDWRGFLVDADAVAALKFFDRATKAAAHDDWDIVLEAGLKISRQGAKALREVS